MVFEPGAFPSAFPSLFYKVLPCFTSFVYTELPRSGSPTPLPLDSPAQPLNDDNILSGEAHTNWRSNSRGIRLTDIGMFQNLTPSE